MFPEYLIRFKKITLPFLYFFMGGVIFNIQILFDNSTYSSFFLWNIFFII